MDRRLGEPLPHQQANPTQAPPAAGASKERPPLIPPLNEAECYAVLARVSPSCPPLLGRFLRVTHPSATLITPEGAFSFDLHVLGLPPTFNLSHDQTLQFNFAVQQVAQKGFGSSMNLRVTHTNGLFAAGKRNPPKGWPAVPAAAYMVNFFGLKEQDPGACPPRVGCALYACAQPWQDKFHSFFAKMAAGRPVNRHWAAEPAGASAFFRAAAGSSARKGPWRSRAGGWGHPAPRR